ncbi:hypothetical protein Tco_1452159, partial [Tanacetum coccineum]
MTLSPSSFHKRYRSFYETPSPSASPASSLTLPIRKRYRGTSEPKLDTETEDDESEAEGAVLKSEESEDEGPGSEGEEVASEEQQQQAVPVKDTTADEPLGLGYRAAKGRSLELAEDPIPTSPVTTPAATIAVDEDEFITVGAQLELHGSILHDHTQRLNALPPTLLEGMGQDIMSCMIELNCKMAEQDIPPPTITAMKIPIIRKGEYDIWSMRMRQYICHTDHNLWDVIVNGDLEEEPAPTGETSAPPAPKTAKQLADRRKQERVKSILLLAIPNEYLLKFHNVTDAKSLLEAI